MAKRRVALLIFAIIVLVGFASFTLYRFFSDTQLVLAPGKTVRLVLASRDLEPGTVIRESDLVLTDWPAEVPTGTFSHTQDVVGRAVITKIYAKEPILETRLALKGAVRRIRQHDPSGYAGCG